MLERAVQKGGTLTFLDQMFSWKELDAAHGRYIVGFRADDLDGGHHEMFAGLTVEY